MVNNLGPGRMAHPPTQRNMDLPDAYFSKPHPWTHRRILDFACPGP
jgi:hypothetical protein